MASADVRQELDCSICLNIYTDPVTLRCGHNFCRVCIDRVLDTQEGSGVYSCPECGAESQERPALIWNITLCNIVERLTTRPDQEETGIFFTHCTRSTVPAAKSCLHWEVSLCDNHLGVHPKSPEHVLCDPTTSPRSRKCSVHNKIMEYYCTEDSVCICVSCSVAGEHRGHLVEILEDAAGKKRNKLRNVLQKLIKNRQETEKSVQRLKKRVRRYQEKAADLTEQVTALFIDIRIQLEDLEKRVLGEIFRQEESVSSSVSGLIQQKKKKNHELSQRMRHIEELCNTSSDPVTVLQDPGDWCDTEDRERHEEQVHGGGDLDVGLISGKLQTLSDIIIGIKNGIYIQEATDRSLRSPDITGVTRGNPSPPISGVLPLDLPIVSIVPDCPLQTSPPSPCNSVSLQAPVNGDFTGVTSPDPSEIPREPRPADVLLDRNTASNNIIISDDRKTATSTNINRTRSLTAERFQLYRQVMSSGGFSSGRHYWEVDVRRSGTWGLGMCYPSIDRRGRQSLIGYNKKSWCLVGGRAFSYQLSVRHDSIMTELPGVIPCDRVRICLDYEAGQLSFYSLCDPIRHLHTFSSTFTEPLHAVLYVFDGCLRISG